MAQTPAILPDRLVRLARLTGELLGGPAEPAIVIDEPLVMLALRRHQVGPLLYAAIVKARHPIAPPLLQRLQQSYQANAAGQQRALARLHHIAQVFSAHGIEWMTIKGPVQAGRLYADGAWRFSSDIDILVPDRDYARALDTLMAQGFIASNPPMAAAGLLRKPILSIVKDISLIARDDHTFALELHRKLFLAGGRRVSTIRLKAVAGFLPAPAVGADLALYVIAHGAGCYWARLKWLTDLVPIFENLDDEEKHTLPARACAAGIGASFAASLLLLRTVFPFAALGPLLPWLAQQEGIARVQNRLQCYRQTITLADDWKKTPLDSRRLVFGAVWSLFEAPSTRMRFLFLGPLSSAMRRIIARLSPEDRALTRCDTPHDNRDPNLHRESSSKR